MGTNNSVNYQPVQYNVIVGDVNGKIASVAPTAAANPLVTQRIVSGAQFSEPKRCRRRYKQFIDDIKCRIDR